MQQSDYVSARDQLEEALTMQRAVGDKMSIAWAAQGLGSVLHCMGDYAKAAVLYEESLKLFRDLGDRIALIGVRRRLGHLALRSGDYEQATTCFQQSFATAREHKIDSMTVLCLAGLAGLASVRGEPERAARLFGAVSVLREANAAGMPEVDRIEHDYNLAILRSMLDDDTFTAAWSEGRAMTMEQAIAYALGAAVAA
jgi:tetratricopeptide (TPR) repeat protein